MTQPISQGSAVAARVVRHALANRIYHWVTASCVLVLLFTGFLPIVGIKFPWVGPHWIAGIVLCGALLFHIPRAVIWDGLRTMAPNRRDLRIARQALNRELGRTRAPPDRPGKYPLAQKLHHHAIALAALATVVTGLLMLVRTDTPMWRRDPYWLTDQTWGVVYVLHDLGAMLLVPLIMVHIYFALRPEKRWLTRSMIFGWISGEDYGAKFDRDAWPVLANPQAAREKRNVVD